MTETEFNLLISTYGADKARWPQDQRGPALAFIAADPDAAKALLGPQAALDQDLARAKLFPGTDLLRARILQEISADEKAQPNLAPPEQTKRAFGLRSVAAMVIGAFALGFGGASWMAGGFLFSDEPQAAQSAALTDAASDDWQEAAIDFGIGDIYDWIGGE